MSRAGVTAQRYLRRLGQAIVQGDLEVATALAEAGQLVEYLCGEVVIHEGGADRDMYFLLMGQVGISVNGKYWPRERNLTVGEMYVVDPSNPRSATVTAMAPTVALKISPEILDRVAHTRPRVYRLIAADLAKRLLQRNSLIRSPNEKARVFFISSKESLAVAKAVRHGLKYTEADSIL